MAVLPPDRRRLRASDADRDATVETIRRHGSLGRLDLEETTERIGQALSAKTLGELSDLVADLPPEGAAAAAPAPMWRSLSLWARGAELLVIDLVCLALWLVGGARGAFWPLWVFLLSLVFFARKVTKVAEREERRRQRPARGRAAPPWLDR